jgi:hypothetical protein
MPSTKACDPPACVSGRVRGRAFLGSYPKLERDLAHYSGRRALDLGFEHGRNMPLLHAFTVARRYSHRHGGLNAITIRREVHRVAGQT